MVGAMTLPLALRESGPGRIPRQPAVPVAESALP